MQVVADFESQFSRTLNKDDMIFVPTFVMSRGTAEIELPLS